jgi:drug/metabolite transporter (DMT)-like permease
MDKRNKAYIFASLVVLLWSTVASAFKITLRYMNFSELLLFSSFVSLLIFALIISRENKWGLIGNLSKREYLLSAFLGFLNPYLYYLVLFKAYSLLPAQEAQPLNYTWPIVLVFLSVPLLKQKIKFRSVVALFIGFSGVYVISTRGRILGSQFTNLTGISLALCSAFIWSLYWIYNLKDRRDHAIKLFLNFSFGFLFILFTELRGGISIPPFKGILGAIYVGIFEMGVTFFLWLKALEYSDKTAEIANLIYLIPFLSLIFIHFVVGEEIFPSTPIGLILIVAGIIIQKFGGSG